MNKKLNSIGNGILLAATFALLIGVSGVTAQAKRNAPVMAEMELVAKERQKWDALKTGTWGELKNMFADDCLSIGYRPDGSVRMDTKAQTFAAEGKLPAGIGFELSDFKVIFADKNSAVITYIAEGPIKVHATSVWAHRGNEWKTIFYQATMTK